MSITIFLTDDHAVVRDGLRLLLETQPDFKVIGDAGDGREAVRRIKQLCPDIAILDVVMPNLNGIEAARQIAKICPDTKIVILSMISNSGHIAQALQVGVAGYILKSSVGDELIEAVRMVYNGGRYFSQKIPRQSIDNYLTRLDSHQDQSPLNALSPRELEILQMVTEGKTSAEIADLLALSSSTIDTYRSRLMKKLDIKDLPGLVKFAIQHGLISLD